ncbi:MAG: phytanoyl-CoA dioxygenase [Phycisphaerae bacterium]|nr:MAG: phytanoyl-CoA dioxygenase [Phycisphaerae bacterium]
MAMGVGRFAADGIAVVSGVLRPAEVERLCDLGEPLLRGAAGPRPGVRRALEKVPEFADVLNDSQVPALAERITGPAARVVRSILFDKSADTWAVPWHQDATVALRERADAPGFGPWSVKDGEAHARPPRELLDEILVVRLHLDDCGPDNGPLRVIPGSHRSGVHPERNLGVIVETGPVVECVVKAGDAVLMRPHSVHSSPRATRPARRRVLHLEMTARELPTGLAWGETAMLSVSRG